MTENLDDAAIEGDDAEVPVRPGGVEALFGGFSVLSPGVEIVLEGRTVSARVAD